jgi:hypothetical protein
VEDGQSSVEPLLLRRVEFRGRGAAAFAFGNELGDLASPTASSAAIGWSGEIAAKLAPEDRVRAAW